MFCGKCGAQNLENATFCKECGAPLNSTSSISTGSDIRRKSFHAAFEPLYTPPQHKIIRSIATKQEMPPFYREASPLA